MKIGLLKKLRREFAGKYEIRPHKEGDTTYYRIYTSADTFLSYPPTTKRGAEIELKMMYYDFLEKYCWEHNFKRRVKKNLKILKS